MLSALALSTVLLRVQGFQRKDRIKRNSLHLIPSTPVDWDLESWINLACCRLAISLRKLKRIQLQLETRSKININHRD